MLFNHLIVALRNFRKNKFYLLVNIIGLAIGITCCLVVYSIMKHELTFDDFHDNKKNIYRVVQHWAGEYGMSYDGITPNAMGYALLEQKQLISDVIPMHGPMDASIEFEHDKQHKVFIENNILFSSPSFLNNLNFPILQGAESSILAEPYKAYITEKIAKKFFGSDNPIGQFVTYDEDHKLEIVGILANTPTNTNVPFEILISYPTIREIYPDYVRSWGSYWVGSTYIVAREDDDLGTLEEEITQLAHGNVSEYSKERISFHLQPLSEVHLDSKYGDGVNYVAPNEILIGFVLLALITLGVSILNFVNLATAQAVQRSREIGIRKTLGSSKSQLVFQFFGETFILVVLATFIAFTLGQVFINTMNEYLSIIAFEIGYDQTTVLFAVLLAIFVTILGGFYPAVVLSGYNPINALNNQISLKGGTGNLRLRKGLVIAQFVVANLLIISTIIVAAQMRYVKTTDLGFDRSNVVVIQLPNKLREKISLIKAEYEQLSFVKGATACMGAPQSQQNWNTNYEISGFPRTENLNTNIKFIDDNYLDLYKIPLLYGRNVSRNYTSDTTCQVLVNREFLGRVGIPVDSAVGLNIGFMGSWKGEIIGVVEDFHMWSLQNKIGPVLMFNNPQNMGQINLRLSSSELHAHYEELEAVFRKFSESDYFMVDMLDDHIEEAYIVENLVYGTFQIFAAMAILIGIFGLYGLVSFMVARNQKSISIRKVFGANINHILAIFGKDYAILMIISFLFAIPAAYFLCSEWLNGFEYRISITAGYFAIGLAISVLILIVSVGYRSFQAASANPADSLRNE